MSNYENDVCDVWKFFSGFIYVCQTVLLVIIMVRKRNRKTRSNSGKYVI